MAAGEYAVLRCPAGVCPEMATYSRTKEVSAERDDLISHGDAHGNAAMHTTRRVVS